MRTYLLSIAASFVAFGCHAGLLVLHLDFNTVQMRRESVVESLREAAKAGYNAVLWEVENKVRWETCPECVHPEAFSKAEFREILSEAERLGLEPIPLLQTFGHAEYVLGSGCHADWREDPSCSACYCTSKPEVRAFLKRLLAEYLDLFGPGVRHFHLGGDEALVFGTCPACRDRNKMDLYVEHLNAVAEELIRRGIRPGVWADMMLVAGDWNRRSELAPDPAELAKLPRTYTLWNWNYAYGYAPDTAPRGGRPNRLEFSAQLAQIGYSVIVCGASQSANDTVFLPFYARHRDNLAATADMARREGHLGFCCTSWSVHLSDKRLQYPLWDFAAKRYLDPAATVAEDYAAAVRGRFGGLSCAVLDRLGEGGLALYGFDARQRGYLKPALPAEPGALAERLEGFGRQDAKTRASRLALLRSEIASLDSALAAVDLVTEGSDLLGELVEASRLKRTYATALLDVLEGRMPKPLPISGTEAFYGRFQTPRSATNAAALAWSVLAQKFPSGYPGGLRILHLDFNSIRFKRPAIVTWPKAYETKAIGGDLGYVHRTERHGISPYDWQWMLDFADGIFKKGLEK